MHTAAPLEIPTAGELLTELAAGNASRAIEELAICFDCPPEALAATLASLVEAGEVELWAAAPDGPSVALSPLAAERLGLQISVEDSRYCRSGCRAADLERSAVAAWQPEPDCGFDGLVDEKALTPHRLASVTESWEREYTRLARAAQAGEELPGEMPLPTIFAVLGISITWPPTRLDGEPCPGCHGSRLRPNYYCAVCDRSGVDHRLPVVTNRPTPRRAPRGGRLRGGV